MGDLNNKNKSISSPYGIIGGPKLTHAASNKDVQIPYTVGNARED